MSSLLDLVNTRRDAGPACFLRGARGAASDGAGRLAPAAGAPGLGVDGGRGVLGANCDSDRADRGLGAPGGAAVRGEAEGCL